MEWKNYHLRRKRRVCTRKKQERNFHNNPYINLGTRPPRGRQKQKIAEEQKKESAGDRQPIRQVRCRVLKKIKWTEMCSQAWFQCPT